MSSWNRLTNELRDGLVDLPVWTTEDDRRRALSYEDRHLAEAREAVAAVRAGRRAPANLGEIVAVARYEAAGWMPDGGFDRWRRWTSHEVQQLDAGALVQWLGLVETEKQRQLADVEARMSAHCKEQDDRAAQAQAEAARAHHHLNKHHQKLILACLSVGDTEGAREIALRVPAGSERDVIDNVIHEMSALYSADNSRRST